MYDGQHREAVIRRELARQQIEILAREGAITVAGGIVFRGAMVGSRYVFQRVASTATGQTLIRGSQQVAQRAVLISALEVGGVNLERGIVQHLGESRLQES